MDNFKKDSKAGKCEYLGLNWNKITFFGCHSTGDIHFFDFLEKGFL